MQRILIIGATSGIGLELARQYIKKGDRVGGCGRSAETLQNIRSELGEDFFPATLDIRDAERIPEILNTLITTLGGMDTCIISSSISARNPDLAWDIEADVLRTNIIGYAAAAIFAADYFVKQGNGHLVGITSVAKFFGNRHPAYSASKAFESIYLRGLRISLAGKGIHVTEIIPGFVRTPLIENSQRTFWVVPVEKASRQIIHAIAGKKRTAYISNRWHFAKVLLPLIPYSIWRRIL